MREEKREVVIDVFKEKTRARFGNRGHVNSDL